MTCLLARYYFDNWTLYSPAVCYEHVRLSWNFNESSNTMTLLLGITLGAARGTPGMAAALALIEKRSGWKQKENTTHNKKHSTQKARNNILQEQSMQECMFHSRSFTVLGSTDGQRAKSLHSPDPATGAEETSPGRENTGKHQRWGSWHLPAERMEINSN